MLLRGTSRVSRRGVLHEERPRCLPVTQHEGQLDGSETALQQARVPDRARLSSSRDREAPRTVMGSSGDDLVIGVSHSLRAWRGGCQRQRRLAPSAAPLNAGSSFPRLAATACGTERLVIAVDR